MKHNYSSLLEKQREFFLSGKTKSPEFRLEMLKKLKKGLLNNIPVISKGLQKDLGQTFIEIHSASLGSVMGPLNDAIKNLKKWMTRRKVKTTLLLQPGKCYRQPEPYGVVLIQAPWNYPVSLLLAPLVGAIAAGNCAVLKPSEMAPATSQILDDIISSLFPEEYIKVIQGGVKEITALLEERFDYIFFTGSPRVGKIIMEKASKHLTPVTLELGGTNPCIIGEKANLKAAARRIAFGKFFNAGQTCVAPNTVYIKEDLKAEFIEELTQCITSFYGKDPEKSSNYGRIVGDKFLDRLVKMLDGEKIILGGKNNKREKFLAPTLVDEPAPDSLLRQEEIFGPILPIVSFKNLDDLLSDLEKKEKCLSLYLYTEDKKTIKEVNRRLSSGSLVINQTIVQVSNYNLPFGGVGQSGMGQYHGKFTFDTFSHLKSVYHRKGGFDLKMTYPPYSKKTKEFFKKMFIG